MATPLNTPTIVQPAVHLPTTAIGSQRRPSENKLVSFVCHKLVSETFLFCAVLALTLARYKEIYYPARTEEKYVALEWCLYFAWFVAFVWFCFAWCYQLHQAIKSWQSSSLVRQDPLCECPTDFIFRLLCFTLTGLTVHLIVVPTVNATTSLDVSLKETLLAWMPLWMSLAALGSAMKSGIRMPLGDAESTQQSQEMDNLPPSGQIINDSQVPAANAT